MPGKNESVGVFVGVVVGGLAIIIVGLLLVYLMGSARWALRSGYAVDPPVTVVVAEGEPVVYTKRCFVSTYSGVLRIERSDAPTIRYAPGAWVKVIEGEEE